MHALENHNDIFIDVQDKMGLLKRKEGGGEWQDRNVWRVEGWISIYQIPCDSSAIFLSSLQM